MKNTPKISHGEEQPTLGDARRAELMPSPSDVCQPILRNTSVTEPKKPRTKTEEKHLNQ